ncbi:MAG: hypothetical protein GY918_14155 [Gammaproteobacteria bacterium]|nr:hypothetical protein [Gammaproteobacteria bacterium]
MIFPLTQHLEQLAEQVEIIPELQGVCCVDPPPPPSLPLVHHFTPAAARIAKITPVSTIKPRIIARPVGIPPFFLPDFGAIVPSENLDIVNCIKDFILKI